MMSSYETQALTVIFLYKSTKQFLKAHTLYKYYTQFIIQNEIESAKHEILKSLPKNFLAIIQLLYKFNVLM